MLFIAIPLILDILVCVLMYIFLRFTDIELHVHIQHEFVFEIFIL